MEEDLRNLLDREAVRRCIERLARGEDRRNGEMIKASYWPDSVTDYGVFQGTFQEYFDWVIPGADAIKDTQHVLGQTWTELQGEVALAETHVVSYHRVDMGAEHRDTCIGGRYLDRLERRAIDGERGEWRIASRTMLYDWYSDWGAAIDWSQGVMGMPLREEWFSGRANGDYSERFFAGEAE
jgi:hypothetical protein